ncbi:ADP-ribosylation factor 4 [Mortierella sp. GBAus27b]|nr:Arf GTPase arf3 [Mortierella sp. GBA43]KAI8346582.1 ADP-ribosylation factor 4 [Mortierella sp. GBAus27b]
MGSIFSKLCSLFVSKTPTDTLMVGLDATGKSTILSWLKLGEVVTKYAPHGFREETITHNNLTLTVWEVFSQGGIMGQLWCHYFPDTIGLIFVVDSSDTDMMDEAKEYLWRKLRELDEAGLEDAPLLVYANKQDVSSALLVSEVRDALDLTAIHGREWRIQGSVAIVGQGLWEGLEWFIAQVQENRQTASSQ